MSEKELIKELGRMLVKPKKPGIVPELSVHDRTEENRKKRKEEEPRRNYVSAKKSGARLPVPPPHILKTLTPFDLELLGNYYIGPKDDTSDTESQGDSGDDQTGPAVNYNEADPLAIPPDLDYIDSDDDTPLHSVYVRKYKKVADRIRPVPTTMPEKYRTVRRIPSDPLLSLPELPTDPPEFVPTGKFTRERLEKMDINKDGFLWDEEQQLCIALITLQQGGIAWDASERGSFREDYFDPIVIPTIEHVPWAEKNIPIPPGIYEKVVAVLKEKLAIGIYEPSNSSYRSRWFCVLKKDGESLRLVHDLQPLNAVTIRDAGLIPFVDSHAEMLGGRGCFANLDLFVAFDHRKLADESRDLTTFHTPLGTLRLTSIPMGATNSVQILHGDVVFVLRDEMPEVAAPFLDDVAVKGPPTRYETDKDGWYIPSPLGLIADENQSTPVPHAQGEDGVWYEVIKENSGIRRFVWEHMNNVNRVIQRIKKSGGTFSGWKMDICAPSIVAVGHKCTYEGRLPEDPKVKKIINWPACETLTEVRGFLGVCGVVRIWIKDYSKKARPLVILTRKEVEFQWDEDQRYAMNDLKDAVINAPCLRPINYQSDFAVILAVDASYIALGYVIYQIGADDRRYPSRFGSLTWNDRESRYSQAKLEIYGLWRALRAVRLHIIGVRNLVVEVDAEYIRGMLNNPDIQPNAAVNRWIVGIKLFDFKLVHVPAEKHAAPDGLSRRRRSPEDSDDEDDEEKADDWLDKMMSFAVVVVNSLRPSSKRVAVKSLIPDHSVAIPYLNISLKTPEPSPLAVYLTTDDDGELEPEDILYADNYEEKEIPQSDRSRKAEEKLRAVRRLLESPLSKEDLPANELRHIVKYASQFFILEGRLMKRDMQGRHKIVPDPGRRYSLIAQSHDQMGHRGIFTTIINLKERFWWPLIDHNVSWFVSTCLVCQQRQLTQVHIPPTVPDIPTLFRKVHIDVMHLPRSHGMHLLVQARCALSSWPEWRALRSENTRALSAFIFEEILCRWGGIAEIVTDNGPAFVAAADELARKYGIRHIRISAYNKQANGLVERKHYDVREAMMKTANNVESQWLTVAPHVFWAERVTIKKSIGYSPFFMAHGVEAIQPFDIAESTYLVPALAVPATTEELIAHRARQLQKRPRDLSKMVERVKKARYDSLAQYIRRHANTIRSYDFEPGDLVLVRNTSVESSLNKKTKPRYLGPMVVVHRNKGGAYILSEADGAVAKLAYAAFRIVPFQTRFPKKVELEQLLTQDDLEEVRDEADSYPLADEAEVGLNVVQGED